MTTRKQSVRSPRAALSGLENEVMGVVWKLGECDVDAAHRVVGAKRDIKETTTRTILRRLEHKGYLTHREAGRAYVYKAVEAPSSLAARTVRQIVDRFCRGSVEELVSGMIESKVLTPEELDSLEALIRKAKKEFQ